MSRRGKMREILFVKPIFKTMIWGGNRLRTDFNYDIPGDNVGECWAISAHPSGDCEIKAGTYKGETLSRLWTNHPELFGNRKEKAFPLLIKIIDAKKDLSIQVHPDDAYADKYQPGSFGKTECWYVLDCDENTEIVIGHNAKDKKELVRMIDEKRWKELIRVKPIKKGDFFQITPGTVHAIKAGTMLLETQQSSDITFRLYDYDRLDNGKPRQLHIKESIDVISCPHRDVVIDPKITGWEGGTITELINDKHYTVQKIDIDGTMAMEQDKDFMNVSVIDGEGEIDNIKIAKGDHFIIPFGYGQFSLTGKMSLIRSFIDNRA
jgi:mannose-6-phosphate isomerase